MYLHLTQDDRRPGSYFRREFKGDVLYTFFRYKQVAITFAKKNGTPCRVTDALADRLEREGMLPNWRKAEYEARVCRSFEELERYDDFSVEQVYAHILKLRMEILGRQNLCRLQAADLAGEPAFTPTGIDQSALRDAMIRRARAVIFVMCAPELSGQMRRDLELAKGKGIYILCGERGGDLPDRITLANWLKCDGTVRFLDASDRGIYRYGPLEEELRQGGACLLFYGEEGLLHCRGLTVDAAVACVPRGYYAQAQTNELGSGRGCVVYVPKGLDVTQYVKLRERTRLSYWQLAKLWEDRGERIYDCTAAQLYERYPQYFLNIYENGARCREADPGYPISVPGGIEDHDRNREQAIKAYLDGFGSIRFTAAYFDENMERRPICYDSAQNQPGVLVHTVRVKQAAGARVIACGKNIPLRQKLSGMEPGIVSNFLFFLTPKLGVLYNDLRRDRPREQANAAGHLDYKLCYENGKRVETFPLFRKTCIAMKENGQFLFFRFRLGGGSVRVGEHTVRWEAEQVDTDSPCPVKVYTPYGSVTDEEADRQTYRRFVGEGRVNLVILQDRLWAVRRGDVVLPSVGVVLSLDEASAAPLLAGMVPLEDGYYDPTGLELTVRLDPPAQVPEETWKQVKWAYGGGLSLILDGQGLCDGAHMEQWFRREGWMSPLSRQTQESTLHTLVKHPRTAVGTTENGELVLLVYSGRTWRSTGADYREMIQIARTLYPDIRCLMNMDGGGSAVMGMVAGGSFMELSTPSTSAGSCVGMVRPVNTVLYIPAGERT